MLKDNLRKYRKACGYNQSQVADVLGLERSAYSYYECGKTEPNVYSLVKLAKMFGVDVNSIVGFECEAKDDEKTLKVANDIAQEYASCVENVKSLGGCSAEEKLLIAYFRAIDNKEEALNALIELHKKQDEAKAEGTEE